MAEDFKPTPDPTLLTTEQLFREVERLKEYVEALRSTDREAVKLAAEEREKAAAALREQLTLRVDSGDASLREHVQAQVAQIHAALLSADELERARFASSEARVNSVQREVALVHEASERAIFKAEAATEKRFESVNAFRAQLAAQTSSFLPREVAESQFEAMNKRLGVLEAANRFDEGRQKGVGMSAGVLVAALGAVATIITIVIVLANVLTGK